MDHTPLYIKVYEDYKELILSGRLAAGTKMPSLRSCSHEKNCSRTTVENAYLQLCADGYILARPQSGFYVTDIASHHEAVVVSARQKPGILYDFASSGADRESFRFDLWRRYLKSALRQDDRLLSYGEPQGEYDFRLALCEYVRKRRNIICSPEDIVVGAGTQSLLQLLIPLLKDRKTVSFPTPDFVHGAAIFSDYGYEVSYRNKDADVVYVSPAHMTRWGEVMPVSRRMELIRHARKKNSLILEDDLENEFVYMQKPTPSLYSLDGGKNVLYLGSFSRLLLPSIRISFMILPASLQTAYHEKSRLYNQTASKSEQIALTQFIRDGHMQAQARRLRRLYSSKLRQLTADVKNIFGDGVQIRTGAAGTSLAVTLPSSLHPEEICKKAAEKGLRIQVLSQDQAEQTLTLLLSASYMPVSDFPKALCILKEVL